jgi:hypothetical protein
VRDICLELRRPYGSGISYGDCVGKTNSMIGVTWIEYLRGGGDGSLYILACVLVAGRSQLPVLE